MKNFLRKDGILLVIILLFSFALFTYNTKTIFFQKTPLETVIKASPLTPSDLNIIQEKINLPLRLQIPKLGVDAEIEYVAINSVGEMDVPKNYNNVAWFSPGSLPGEKGSAVIAGHFDNQNGEEAVFYNLQDLKKDDQLFIEDKEGNIKTFIVRKTRLYDSKTFTPEVFISSEGEHLNLITCTGRWDESKKSYSQRLVVFTDVLY